MKTVDPELLRRTEKLIQKTQNLHRTAPDQKTRNDFDFTLKALAALAEALMRERPLFGIEPWHALYDDMPLASPGEMLLRLQDSRGVPIPSYPVIMNFYRNAMTADIDAVLFLRALTEFAQSDEQQVSINISARSLRDAEFVKVALERLETLNLPAERKIIIEIHESTPNLIMNKKVLELFRKAGLLFAIDDVGLHMNDVLRLSEFEGIADFIKLDRHSVNSNPQKENSLDHVVSFIHAILPDAVMVAEGVKSAEHAHELRRYHPDIRYVQGLYLPAREEFRREWNKKSAA